MFWFFYEKEFHFLFLKWLHPQTKPVKAPCLWGDSIAQCSTPWMDEDAGRPVGNTAMEEQTIYGWKTSSIYLSIKYRVYEYCVSAEHYHMKAASIFLVDNIK